MTQLFENMTSQIENSIHASFSEFSLSSGIPLKRQSMVKWLAGYPVAIKRSVDIIASFLFIMAGLPMMLMIALVIKLTSRGPVFFMQERIGYQGRSFRIIKFRTMRPENSEEEHQDYIQNLLKEDFDVDPRKVISDYFTYIDQRTTSFGRFLRTSSLDELPQLFNILLGHMSLVGPRPHPVYEVQEYKEWYKRRLHVKPGLTGWSKLNLRLTPQNYEESILYDLWYVDNWSNFLDMKIIMMTVPFVLSMKDAH